MNMAGSGPMVPESEASDAGRVDNDDIAKAKREIQKYHSYAR